SATCIFMLLSFIMMPRQGDSYSAKPDLYGIMLVMFVVNRALHPVSARLGVICYTIILDMNGIKNLQAKQGDYRYANRKTEQNDSIGRLGGTQKRRIDRTAPGTGRSRRQPAE